MRAILSSRPTRADAARLCPISSLPAAPNGSEAWTASWGRRKRDDHEVQAQDADLAKRAGSALVAVDERIRVTADELVFAETELGPDATTELRRSPRFGSTWARRSD